MVKPRPVAYASPVTDRGADDDHLPFWTTPVGWPLLIFTTLFCVAALVSVRHGAAAGLGSVSALACNGTLLGLTLFSWLIRCVVRHELVGGKRGSLSEDKRIGWKGIAVPCIALTTIMVIYFSLHTRLMFEYSRSSFDAAMKAVTPGKRPPAGWYGLYRVREVIRSGNGNEFFVLDDVGFMDPQYIGFEYAPAGLPKQPQPEMPSRIDLGGGWYWNYAFEG